MKLSSLWFVAPALALAACNTQTGNKAEIKPGSEIGINTAWMDKSVVPGDDFFGYADGNWVKTTEIPKDRSRIGGFWIADLEREKNSRELFDDILKANPTSGAMLRRRFRCAARQARDRSCRQAGSPSDMAAWSPTAPSISPSRVANCAASSGPTAQARRPFSGC